MASFPAPTGCGAFFVSEPVTFLENIMGVTPTQWMVRVFWKGFAVWAAKPGNDTRAANMVANILERVAKASETVGEVDPGATEIA